MCDALCNVVIPICPPLAKYFIGYNDENYVLPPEVALRPDDVCLFIFGLITTLKDNDIRSLYVDPTDQSPTAQYFRSLHPLSIGETTMYMKQVNNDDGERFYHLIPRNSGFCPDVYIFFEKPAPLMQIFMGHLWQVIQFIVCCIILVTSHPRFFSNIDLTF